MRRRDIVALCIAALLIACNDDPFASERVGSSGQLLIVSEFGDVWVRAVDVQNDRRVGRWYTSGLAPTELRVSPSGSNALVALLTSVTGPTRNWLTVDATSRTGKVETLTRLGGGIDFLFVAEDTVAIATAKPGVHLVTFPALDSIAFIPAPIISEEGEQLRVDHAFNRLALSPRDASVLWAVQGSTQTLVQIDLSARDVKRVVRDAPYDARSYWRGAAFKPDGSELWLWTNEGVSVRAPDTGELQRSLPALGVPADLMFSPDGEYVFLRYSNRRLAVGHATTGQILHEATLDGTISGWSHAPDGSWLYVSLLATGDFRRDDVFLPTGHGAVVVLDPRTLQERRRVRSVSSPHGIAAIQLSR